MTAPLLERLEELEAKATPLPWVANPYGLADHGSIGRPYQSNDRGDFECDKVAECDDNDADLIVAARNALPAPLRLARAAEAWDAIRDGSSKANYVGACDEVRAALAALRGAG